jgi:hypothetical protein
VPFASSTGGAPLASGLFCDEADVVELVSESEIVDVEPSAKDLPSVEVIVDEDPSLPAFAAFAGPPATPSSGPVPTEDMFAEDDPTVRLGSLPPAPFPRHLGGSSPPMALGSAPPMNLGGSLPPMHLDSLHSLRSPRVPREFLTSNISSSIEPMAIDSSSTDFESRRMPTMRIRAAGDEPSVVVVRGRPNFLWGVALLAAGVLAGIVGSQGLFTPAAPTVVLTAPPPPAAEPGTSPRAAGAQPSQPSPIPATSAERATDRAHVEPTSAAPIEAPPTGRVAVTSKPAAPAAAIAAAASPATVIKATASQAPAPTLAKKSPAVVATTATAAPSLGGAPPAAGVTKIAPKKGSTTAIANDEIANDQAADALARAQLKAALR